jgi:hypothetical protein
MINWFQHVPRNQETVRLKHIDQACRLDLSGVCGTACAEKHSENLTPRGKLSRNSG